MVKIYIDMCADLFHSGHVNFMRNVKSKCDYLIVGLHNDETIESYKYKKPIMTLSERMEVVKACKYVDEVIADAPLEISEEFFLSLSVDFVAHAHGTQESEKYMYMYKNVPKDKFIRLDYLDGISTTDIIDRVLKIHDSNH